MGNRHAYFAIEGILGYALLDTTSLYFLANFVRTTVEGPRMLLNLVVGTVLWNSWRVFDAIWGFAGILLATTALEAAAARVTKPRGSND